MSKCGRTHLLEAMTAGEVPAPLETELRAHASGCARCRHELSWLDSEQRLFRHRAGRDEVAQLWRGIEARTPLLRRGPSMHRVMVALAAALLVVLGMGRMSVTRPTAGTSQSVSSDDELQTINELMFMSSEDPQTSCSRLTPGLGFTCGAPAQSSVLASR